MEYRYRPMTIGDYEEIYALWRSLPGIALGKADQRQNIEAYLARNPGQSFVGEREGRIVGAVLCGNDGRNAYIYHMAVIPEHRRRGVAAELVRLALDEQKKHGRPKCHLRIFKENALGKAFWERQGFSVRQELSIMSKRLEEDCPDA
ncbi:MAG: GNAT family N-acetyltransferase [Peptococcaceae bacterium]|jgi:ribosomal protein S18 acetylase RimI-like enzyme|nr:GNAT family N-acetyltransferase [Peptococcaceae bacterium]